MESFPLIPYMGGERFRSCPCELVTPVTNAFGPCGTKRHMGLESVIAQNYYFSAIQNAKRLHGAPRSSLPQESGFDSDVQSRHFIGGIPYRMKKSQAKQANKPKKGTKRPASAPEGKYILAPATVGQIRTKNPGKVISNSSSDGRIVVTNTEFVADVIPGSAGYGVAVNIPINPGIDLAFPWLCHMAYNYESYRFLKLRYEYRSAVGSASGGRVMLLVDYDAADPAPANKSQFLSNHEAISAPVWGSCDLNCDRPDLLKLPQKFNRYGDLAANLDVKTYDVGHLFVATSGLDAGLVGTSVGEIYVSYVIELITPQLNHLAEIEANSRRITAGGTISKAAPLGDAPAIEGGLHVNVANPTTLHFADPGEYLMTLYKTGTTLVNTVLAAVGAGVTVSVLNAVVSGAATSAMQSARIKVNEPGYVTLDATGDLTMTGLAVRLAPYLYSLV